MTEVGITKFEPLEERIVELLRKDPRAANRDMAKVLGVSEVTVASRIRSLGERQMMQVTAQEDIWALGYDMLVILDIFVSGRSANEVADDIALIDEVGSVSVTISSPELIVQLVARDRTDLARLIDTRIAAIAGVAHIESLIVLDAMKFRSDFGELDAR